MSIATSYDFKTIYSTYYSSLSNDLAASSVDGGVVYGGYSPAYGALAFAVGTNSPGIVTFVVGANMALAGLTNDNYVAVAQDGDSIVYQIFTVNGPAVSGFVDIGDTASTNADVAALHNGGFVIASQDFFGGGDYDIDLRFYNSTGVAGASVVVDGSSAQDQNASMAVLDNGNVAVAWTRTQFGETEIWYSVYSQAGVVVKGPTFVDNNGSTNEDIDIVATPGGFTMAYRDNFSVGAPAGVVAVALRGYDHAGNFNYSGALTTDAAAVGQPSIARLSNGMLTVSWTDAAANLNYALVDPVGLTVLTQEAYEGTANILSGVPETAAYGAGAAFGIISSILPGSAGGQAGNVQVSKVAAVRVLTGDDANDSIFASNEMAHHLIGNGGSDKLNGGSADDELDGGIGNDTLDGNGGIDTARGGLGNDSYFVDSQGDLIVELQGEGTDKVTSSALVYTLSDNVENLTLVGGAGQGSGNELNNTLTGNSLANYLYGNGGNDKLDGKSGADYMSGGLGNDIYYVDNVADVVFEGVGGGKDTVNVSYTTFGFTLGANVENCNLTSSETQSASGNDLANTFTSKGNTTNSHFMSGEGGKDTIKGGAGVDFLLGGADADKLTGGGGADYFAFDEIETSANKDTITDFNSVQGDEIIFFGFNFAALKGVIGSHLDTHPEMFALGSAATTANHHVIYNQATGNLYYDADGVGGAAQVLVALLSNQAAVSAGDILVN